MSEFFKKPVKKAESKVETRFYDELFKRLQDGESDEFKDPESVGNSEFFFLNSLFIKCLNKLIL